MKKFLQLALVLFISFAANAQQNYFVYVQTDNKQPFFIKLNEKIISSSAAGYLVIPKLTTGNYQLMVGFPKDQWAHQIFNIAIGTNDAGYLLKNFGEKGWGLYNIQTMEISMNGAPASSNTKTTSETDDVFAATLSGAANTNLSLPKENIPAPLKETPAPKIETSPTPIKTPTKSIIKKLKTIKDDNGKTVVYTDKHDNNIDTISIFIPAENKTIDKSNEDIETVKTAPIKDKKFLDIEMANPNANTEEKKEAIQKEEPVSTHFVEHKAKKEELVSASIVEPEIKKEEPVSAPIVEPITKKEESVVETVVEPIVKTEKSKLTFNSDCKANATEDDFLKARRKMVAEDNDDDMVDAVKKMFKLKCFTVEQIKNLSALLLNDAGKYKLFDAAYPFTSDTQNFANLQILLKDEYFITRFKAMIRN